MNKDKIELLQSSYDYLRKLIYGIKKELDTLQIGKDMNNILLIVEGVQFILKSLTLTTDIEREDDQIVIKVSGYIKELLEALEDKDIISIKDILEYEFLPMLEEWQVHIHTNLEKQDEK